jgi:outer membrane cobalamin receptor
VSNTSRSKGLLGVPEIFSKSGIYISDSLFSSNLNLKSGFVFTYYGKIKYLNTQGSIFETNPAYTIDFTLSGRIRNAATVYFTWENLLDEKYYLIPYYPALGRNLRFGIAWDLFN